MSLLRSNCTNYPSILYTTYMLGLQGSLGQSQLISGERHGIPWAGLQSIVGLTQRQTTIYTHSQITHADLGRKCKLHTKRP